ncbi:aspartate aminotransferase family protein [Psychromarinibacter sp. C21-152]|uniref:Aspartate aminotransferase family protein n=1 Tax=Psychromarinibacter sediminicola TaxID=3033385 RepID=A0AAE3NUX0_9RHOB|nr:aspartate aminotransferase family protein [Psychromarinibacter sediminicola]MDF0601425.1 aspartate aminotransferase family protein [Psychromarinibacter sediminicola]
MLQITNHMPTEDLRALDAAHHLHPFTHGAELKEKGVRIITRARGVYLTDSDGNEILDAMSGLWCVNIGYGRTELAEVAARQMRELPYYNTFFQTTHVPVIALAARLAEIAPEGMDHAFFASSGSEANDTNIRLVRHYWAAMGKPDKQVIVSRKNAYHGSTMGGASLGGMQPMHAQGGLPIPGIVHIDQPYWWGEGGDMDPAEFGLARARQLEQTIEELGEDKVAAFIAEPIQGAGGVIIPPETYWPEIQRICDEHEILLIADEVICGFGRTGEWFGSQAMNIRPDIMTIAKGVTSGYQPVGGSIVRDTVAEVLNAHGEFFHGYTYSGHPVAAAVALENLRIIEEEEVLRHVREVAAPHLARAWARLGEHPMVGDVQSFGMLAGVALTPDKERRAAFASPKGTVGQRCRERCFANGVVMRHVGDRMIVCPPLVITPEEIDTMVDRAWRAIDETFEQLRAEDLFRPA